MKSGSFPLILVMREQTSKNLVKQVNCLWARIYLFTVLLGFLC